MTTRPTTTACPACGAPVTGLVGEAATAIDDDGTLHAAVACARCGEPLDLTVAARGRDVRLSVEGRGRSGR